MKRKLSFSTLSDLIVRSLEFSEKFTTLHKVIANSLHINKAVRNIGVKTLLVAITLLNISAISELPEFKQSKLLTVVIDAGHGGKDPGTHGVSLKEKDLVLKVALKFGGYIEKNLPDVKVVYTRKDNTFVPVEERARIANNNKANLFISIHANASPSATAYGTETWVMGLDKSEKNMSVSKRENAVILLEENYIERYEGFDPKSPESQILFELTQSAFKENSLKMAAKVEQQFKNRVGRRSLGVKQGPFWVLWATTMPSILIELGFLTNEKEEQYLINDANVDLMASGIYRAFKEYKDELESVN
jgi:N-acetylmuramoyl-L-alanine amidase